MTSLRVAIGGAADYDPKRFYRAEGWGGPDYELFCTLHPGMRGNLVVR